MDSLTLFMSSFYVFYRMIVDQTAPAELKHKGLGLPKPYPCSRSDILR